jgi:hypothetical protein
MVLYGLSGSDVDATLVRDCERTRDFLLCPSKGRGVVELAGGVLEPQPEQLAPRGANVLGEV